MRTHLAMAVCSRPTLASFPTRYQTHQLHTPYFTAAPAVPARYGTVVHAQGNLLRIDTPPQPPTHVRAKSGPIFLSEADRDPPPLVFELLTCIVIMGQFLHARFSLRCFHRNTPRGIVAGLRTDFRSVGGIAWLSNHNPSLLPLFGSLSSLLSH